MPEVQGVVDGNGEPRPGTSAILTSEKAAPWVVFVLLSIIFFATSASTNPGSIDPETNALSAYLIAETGSPIASDYEFAVSEEQRIGQIIWLVPSPRGPVSQYPPGSALLAVPFYWIADVDSVVLLSQLPEPFEEDETLPLPEMWPAALVASLSVAVALGLFTKLLVSEGLSPQQSMMASLVIGLGTGLWSVASDALWQHGPAVMWLVVVMWSAKTERRLLSVLAAAMVVVTRPLAAVLVLAMAIGFGMERKRLAPAVPGLMGLSVGTMALISYNRAIFGSWSVVGGYSPAFVDRVAEPDVLSTVSNVVLAFVALDRGILIYSPFILMVVLGLPGAWQLARPWIRWSALGAAAYVLLQYTANNYQGGLGFGFYRYPLEPLVAAAPLGVLSVGRIGLKNQWVGTLFRLLVGISFLTHFSAATFF